MTTLSTKPNTARIERHAHHEFLALVGLLVAAAADIGWFAALTLS